MYRAFRYGMFLLLASCVSAGEPPVTDIHVVGAMKDVMWEGQLAGKVNLDTIASDGVFGVGPLAFLRGEILILDGNTYVARVGADSSMEVRRESGVSAPFIVFGQTTQWTSDTLPSSVKTIGELETFLAELFPSKEELGMFRLTGRVESAIIHVVNLAPGSTVSNPSQAHQGQVNYSLNNADVDIVGFYSTNHKGVFTHHDRIIHMHLITRNGQWMGHVDALEMLEMNLSWASTE